MSHIPVLLQEMVLALAPKKDEVYVDATFGEGGYSRAILEAADCKVIAIDRDPTAVTYGKALEKAFPGRFRILQGPFSQLKDELTRLDMNQVHGFVFDLGVSSQQIDSQERGFSFRFEGPLDMRMSQDGISAADVVNTYSEKDLADIIFLYGEEKKSRAIARKIVAYRQQEPFRTTNQLADLVKSVVRQGKDGQNPATLTFQALRIYVNDELSEVEKGLQIAEECLLPGGRLVVVTFHSLEDRLVKQFLKTRLSKKTKGKQVYPRASRTQPFIDIVSKHERPPTFVLANDIGIKGITPSQTELRKNPRARSARLRTAIRLSSTQHDLEGVV